MTVLKNVKAALSLSEQSIYTCPAGKNAVILSGTFANGRNGAVSTTVGWKDASDSDRKTPIIDSVSTNQNTTLGILTGKIILEEGDSVYAKITSGDEFEIETIPNTFGCSWYYIISRGTRRIVFGSASNQASKIYSSDNNGAWTLRYTASDTSTSFEKSTYIAANGYSRVADNGSVIVAVRTGGKIVTSADAGVTWTERTSGVSTDLISVKWISHLSLFVVCGENGTILKGSSDGAVWLSVGPNTSGVSFAAIETNGTIVICAGSNTTTPVIYTSTDLATWTSRTTTTVASSIVNGISWNGSKFLITLNNKTNTRLSSDGITWADGSVSVAASCQAAFGGYFITGSSAADSNADKLYVSSDGTTWFLAVSSIETTSGKFITYDSKLYFISTQLIWTSDLNTWNKEPTFHNYIGTANDVVFDSNGKLNAVESTEIAKKPLITTTTNLTLAIMEQTI